MLVAAHVLGRPVDALDLVRRGTVRVWVKWGLPEERTLLATLGDNDFFGERALEGTDGRTASAPPVAQATAECATSCDLPVLPPPGPIGRRRAVCA